MKRLPIAQSKDLSGKQYWRSLSEKANDPDLEAAKQREFPEGADQPPPDNDVSRRNFLTVMGATVAMTSLAACRRPEEKIVPYSRAPEEVIPGNALYYATAIPAFGTALGLIVESHEGRPTKLEGNPRHPDSLGSTDVWTQATILDLYDPDRSAFPLEKGVRRGWDDASAALRQLGDTLRSRKGKGLAIVTEAHRSPTLARLLTSLKQQMPQARVVRYEAFTRQNSREGARIAFGKPLDRVHDTDKARVIAVFDCDLFNNEGSPIKQARGWAAGRNPDGGEMNRLYAFESIFSVTGGCADHRVRMTSREVSASVAALAKELGVGSVDATAAGLSDKAKKTITALAKELGKNRGASLVVAGEKQPAAVHALVAAINVALGNVGKSVDYFAAFDDAGEPAQALVDLAKSIGDKSVDTVVILGGNPAFDAPADAKLADALKGGAAVIHLSTHVNETSALAGWHLNRTHYLEAWGDIVAEDGTASIVQPLIAPLYTGGTSDIELVSILLGDKKPGYELIRTTWQTAKPSTDFDVQWRRWLHDGVIPDTASKPAEATADAASIGASLKSIVAAPSAIEVTFGPDSHAWDGRFANNSWMQEFPDPMTKLTWGNAAWMSLATAKELGVHENDSVTLSGDAGANVTLPVLIAPGQADKSVYVMCGQGRRFDNTVGPATAVDATIGVDTYPLRTSAAAGISQTIKVSKATTASKLARTQENFLTHGRPLVREAPYEEYKKEPNIIEEMVEHPPLLSQWKEWEYKGQKWGMTIDLNQCTGCGACMIACQAENNIPTVGADGVMRSREMHWIRVDRYFEGSEEDPTSVSQPLPCQHCENAPCEQVCPVGATSHSPEGTNDMVYNRCIGTRYCANNCPYKVRRFNFYNYSKEIPQQKQMQFNPDVTVRSRGVMEKCTFCIQRINEAKIDAHKHGEDKVKDGVIVTACESVCPTRAILFGDLNDAGSRIAKHVKTKLGYHLLEELNIKPRVTYLARIRNPNPELTS